MFVSNAELLNQKCPISQESDLCWRQQTPGRRTTGWTQQQTACRWSWLASAGCKRRLPECILGIGEQAVSRAAAPRTAPATACPWCSPERPRNHWRCRRRGRRRAAAAWACRWGQSEATRSSGRCCPWRWGTSRPGPPPPLSPGSPTGSPAPTPGGRETNIKVRALQSVSHIVRSVSITCGLRMFL